METGSVSFFTWEKWGSYTVLLVRKSQPLSLASTSPEKAYSDKPRQWEISESLIKFITLYHTENSLEWLRIKWLRRICKYRDTDTPSLRYKSGDNFLKSAWQEIDFLFRAHKSCVAAIWQSPAAAFAISFCARAWHGADLPHADTTVYVKGRDLHFHRKCDTYRWCIWREV